MLRRTLIALAALTVAILAGGCTMKLRSSVRKEIDLRVERSTRPYAQCYGMALARNPGLRGTLVLSYVVANRTGRFTSVRFTGGNIRDPLLRRCVVNHAQRMKVIKAPLRPVRVTQPLVFEPAT